MGEALLLEGARTNALTYSEDFTNAAWVKVGVSVPVTANAAPDGDSDADTLSLTASDVAEVAQAFTATNAHRCVFTVWLWTTTGTKALRLYLLLKDGTETAATPITVTTTPTRYEIESAIGTGVVPPQAIIRNDAAGTSGDVIAWGAQVETQSGQRWPTSYIRTTSAPVTRAVDVLTVAQASLPAAAWTSGVQIVVAPDFIPADMHTAAAGQSLLGGGGGSGNFVLLSYNAVPDPARIWIDNVTKMSDPCSWAARAQALTMAVRPSVSSTTLSGFTAGNGTTTLASYTVTASDMRIGARGDGSAPFHGRFGRTLTVL